MHKELKDSGLGKLFKINPVTDNLLLAGFIGKTVKFKSELWTPGLGTQLRDSLFVIRETQLDFRGNECLRGYAEVEGDTFGRPLHPEQLDIIC